MADEPEIIFDVGRDRVFDPNRIDYRKLIELMRIGYNPINKGEGWSVVQRDRYDIAHKKPVEDTVISQVKALGIGEVVKESGGLMLKLKRNRDDKFS
jgi:hypothetical protein